MSSSIQNVAVIGAGGNVGKSTVKALLAEGFTVTGLTRESSTAVLPAGVQHIKLDYSLEQLKEALAGQDAVVSTVSSVVAGSTLRNQRTFIDAAIAAGVKVYIPSEFGIDTADARCVDYIPVLVDKVDTVKYLKEKQDRIAWTAVITGSIFDWGFGIPGFGGWDLAKRQVTLYDGGDVAYDATNLDQVGRAIAKCLRNPDATKNQYVYVNSFTVTQKQVLAAAEKATGERFTVSHASAASLWEEGNAAVSSGNPLGALAMIAATFYKDNGLAQYSTTRGLWNDRLGLAGESLDDWMTALVAAAK